MGTQDQLENEGNLESKETQDEMEFATDHCPDHQGLKGNQENQVNQDLQVFQGYQAR